MQLTLNCFLNLVNASEYDTVVHCVILIQHIEFLPGYVMLVERIELANEEGERGMSMNERIRCAEHK
jgi:hypothetical protein